MAAADAQEDDFWITLEAVGGCQNGIELMGPAEVSGIADDKLVFELPLPTQRILARGEGLDLVVFSALSGLVGAEFRQFCFARSGSFGHRLKKLKFSHWLALARGVNLPSPGSGWSPFVLNGEGEIRRVES